MKTHVFYYAKCIKRVPQNRTGYFFPETGGGRSPNQGLCNAKWGRQDFPDSQNGGTLLPPARSDEMCGGQFDSLKLLQRFKKYIIIFGVGL